ncbi:6507_t:CDS:2 [Diversispora eburnea]|uniref:6507_t:CDS:1 n=1 Tax=Diversispora eburnea TaxID=1213867 RepID=A0A9N8ZXG4_9GLOM|nr:6507_t:CDS:2 [Diversispora eburnea]
MNTDFKFHGYSLLSFLKIFIICLSSTPFVFAAENDNSTTTINTSTKDKDDNLKVQAASLGIILIITGITFCFFGRKIYRLTLFLVGFYIGEPSREGMKEFTRLTIILIVSFVIGLLIGGIFVCCSTIAIWFLGVLVGYTLAIFILSWISASAFSPSTNEPSSNGMDQKSQILTIIALTFIGFLLTCLFENIIILFGTSFIGAYSIIIGIEIFIKTDFVKNNENSISVVNAILNGRAILDGNNYEKNTLLLVGMLILFILGVLYQYNFNIGTFYPNGLNHTPKPNYSKFFKDKKRRHSKSEYKNFYFSNDNSAETNRILLTHLTLETAFKGLFCTPIHDKLRSGSKVLDVGCGPLLWSIEMAEDYRNSSFYAVDKEEPSIPEQIIPKNVKFIKANLLENLPFEDDFFDYIFLRDIIMCFEGSDFENIVLKEIFRVLKPGGYFEIVEAELEGYEQGEALNRWSIEGFQTWAKACNIDYKLTLKLKDILLKTNQIEDLKHNKITLPLGNWGNYIVGPFAAETTLCFVRMNEERLCPVMGISVDEYRELVKQIEEEFSSKDYRAHFFYHNFIGIKN